MLGKIHVYTGNGKGKTTAAMGLAARAIGRGKKTKIVQFFKGDTGEKEVLSKLCSYSQLEISHPFFASKNSENETSKERFDEFWKKENEEISKGGFDVVVMDEFGPLIDSKMLKESDALQFLMSKPANCEMILTGRGIPESIIELADYCTEMKEVKHPFRKGIPARKGVEF